MILSESINKDLHGTTLYVITTVCKHCTCLSACAGSTCVPREWKVMTPSVLCVRSWGLHTVGGSWLIYSKKPWHTLQVRILVCYWKQQLVHMPSCLLSLPFPLIFIYLFHINFTYRVKQWHRILALILWVFSEKWKLNLTDLNKFNCGSLSTVKLCVEKCCK